MDHELGPSIFCSYFLSFFFGGVGHTVSITKMIASITKMIAYTHSFSIKEDEKLKLILPFLTLTESLLSNYT